MTMFIDDNGGVGPLPLGGVEATFFLVKVTSQYLTETADLIDSGKLRTNVGTVLPLADAREAHFILEGRRPPPKGKIVLTVETR